MKAIRGPAHPINVPCRRCRVPVGEDCHVMVRGRCCPERERDNHARMSREVECLKALNELEALRAENERLKARRSCPRCSEDLHAVDALLAKHAKENDR